MGFIIILLIIGALIYFKMKQDPKWLKSRLKGKTDEQKKVIRYFLAEGCLASTISDEQYDKMVADKLAEFNFKKKALDKHGLDEDQVQEIQPVNFNGYVFDKAYSKKGKDGHWRSSKYQVSWIFFGESQVYFYQYTFDMDETSKRESTEEYYYKDIVNFSTASETEEIVTEWDKDGNAKSRGTVDRNIFQLIVPGDKIKCSLKLNDETENIIKGMKNKLREKKA